MEQGFYLSEKITSFAKQKQAHTCLLDGMKKGFSIAVALLFILSGMHLSVASHYCMGSLASTRINFTGKTAGCGMESQCRHGEHHGSSFDAHCCSDVVRVYAVENVFSSSAVQHTVKTVCSAPLLIPGLPDRMHLAYYAALPECDPPGSPPITGVSLSTIRVFRI